MPIEWKCAISGVVPEEPVFSKKSGCVFERRLLAEYINANKKDPVNNQPLDFAKDVVVIKNPNNYASMQLGLESSSSYSIPTLLGSLKTEWDAVILENFNLRQQLQRCKEELSDSLFKYDASVKIAAKAMQERDFYKKELAKLTKTTGEDFGELLYNASSEYIRLYKKFIKAQGKKNKFLNKSMRMTEQKGTLENVNFHDFSFTDYNGGSKMISQKDEDFNKLVIVDTHSSVIRESPSFSWLTYKAESLYTYEFQNIQKVIIVGNGKLTCINSWFDNNTNTEYSMEKQEIDYDSNTNSLHFWYLPHIFADRIYILDEDKQTVELKSLTNPDSVGLLLQLDDSAKYFDTNDKGLLCDVHKDGMLFAIYNKESKDIEVYDLSNTNSHQAEQILALSTVESVKNVKFSKNGYYLYINHDHSYSIIDLRQDLQIVATLNYPAGDGTNNNHISSDISGLNLFAPINGGLRWFYKEDKTKWAHQDFQLDDINFSSKLYYIEGPSDSTNGTAMLATDSKLYKFEF